MFIRTNEVSETEQKKLKEFFLSNPSKGSRSAALNVAPQIIQPITSDLLSPEIMNVATKDRLIAEFRALGNGEGLNKLRDSTDPKDKVYLNRLWLANFGKPFPNC